MTQTETLNIQWSVVVFTGSVSSMVSRPTFNAIKTKMSKDVTRIYNEKLSEYHVLLNCHLVESFLPPGWSSEGHLHFSLPNLLLVNNLSVLSLACHVISGAVVGHLLLIMCVSFFFF